MNMNTEQSKIKYIAKQNCKQCHGRGVVIRTWPSGQGRKKQFAEKYRCSCVKSIGRCVNGDKRF